MKPPSNVKTPAQYIASLPADRAETITTVREFVNKHIHRAVIVGIILLASMSRGT